MIAVCDQFTIPPGDGRGEALARIARWKAEFPKLQAEFRDADGTPPRHTFFYSIGQDDSEVLGSLAELCRDTACEVELALSHDEDTAENTRRTLETGVGRLAEHGLLACDKAGTPRYGFIHGHGALDNSHPEGRHCGVCNELAILHETGCYADFTLPTAPDRTQTRKINAIYYARGTDDPKSHDQGRRMQADRAIRSAGADEILLVQGPLTLDWRRRQYGIVPGVENGTLSATAPPTRERLRSWLDCRIAVEGRPNWLFIKLGTNGSPPENTAMLLGEPMRAFHRDLIDVAASDRTLRFHYVSAREMVNIAHAAEAGHTGEPGPFRDFRYRRASASVASTTSVDSPPSLAQ